MAKDKTILTVLTTAVLATLSTLTMNANAGVRFTLGPKFGVVLFQSELMEMNYDATSMPMYGGDIGVMFADHWRIGLQILHGEVAGTASTLLIGGFAPVTTIKRNSKHIRTLVGVNAMYRFGDPEVWPVMPFLNLGVGAAMITEEMAGFTYASGPFTWSAPPMTNKTSGFSGQIGVGIDIKPIPQVSIIIGVLYMATPVQLVTYSSASPIDDIQNIGGAFPYLQVMANLP